MRQVASDRRERAAIAFRSTGVANRGRTPFQSHSQLSKERNDKERKVSLR